MALIRLGRYSDAVNTASAALTHSHGTAVKAWWRRAQAYRELGKYTEAVRDYSEAVKRADEGKVKDEIARELRRLQADLEAKGKEAGRVDEVEKRRVEEERKEKTRADTNLTSSSERLKRMTIVEDDSDEDEEKADEDEKSTGSEQPVFTAPRGGMTIEVLK